MKKTLFILFTLLLVSCNEKQDKTKEPTTTPITKEVEINIEELLSKETINVPQVQKLLSNGKTLPIEYLTQFVNEEIKKISLNPSFDINYEKLYQIHNLGFTLPNVQKNYKEALEKDSPKFDLLAVYLLYGADINTLNSKGKDITKIKSENGKTILYTSCYFGYTDLVKKLIEKNMNINEKDKYGYTYMNASLFSNSENKREIIDLLLKAEFSLERQGLNSLIFASAYDSKENIEKLLGNIADINSKDKNDMTALMFASRNNSKEVVESLIKAGANVNEKSKDGWTPLMQASFYNKAEVIENLIKAGANVNEKNKDGMTPLIMASQNNSKEAVENLIKAGANVNEKSNSGMTVLMFASFYNKAEVIENLIKAGANVNEKNKSGWAPLMIASGYNGKEAVENLIKAGANVNEKSKDGMTPLMYAGRHNSNKEVVESLIKAGANVNEKDKDGWTVLMFASRHNSNKEVVEALIKAGANVNEDKDKNGWTPLMMASGYNGKEVVESLIKAGANVNEKKIDGETAYDVAERNNHDIPILKEKMLQSYIPSSFMNTEKAEFINPNKLTDNIEIDIKKQYQLENVNGYVLLFEGILDAEKVYTFNSQKDFQAINKFLYAPRNRYKQKIFIENGKEPVKVYLIGHQGKYESNIIDVRIVGSTETYWTFREYLEEANK